MTQLETSDLAPVKRPREEIVASTSDAFASINVSKRAKNLSAKISSLYNEFPEMKNIIDLKQLQEVKIESAVQKYKDDITKNMEKGEVKKRKVMINSKESVPLYSLPDELVQNCLSYVGKGHYGLLGLASKNLNEAYAKHFGRETSFLEMATSVNISNFCLSNLCKNLEEKDEILKAAAVNGNLDILRNAVKDGYDLFPLIEMKKFEAYEVDNDEYYLRPHLNIELETELVDIYIANDNEENSVKLSKLVERGHLHVLKYLYEDLNYHKGLQRYIKPAIQYGQLEILKWLQSIDLLHEDDALNRIQYDSDENDMKYRTFNFCDFAVRSGHVEILKWLLDQRDFDFHVDWCIVRNAIRSNSLEMIKFCHENGFSLNEWEECDEIIKQKSVDFYRFLNELGCEFFGEIGVWIGDSYEIQKSFDIIKYLRSISVPWGRSIMKDIVAHGTIDMIKYAREDGCPWTSRGDEYYSLLVLKEQWSLEKFNYIKANGCKCDIENHSDQEGLIYYIVNLLRYEKELVLLEFFVGKDSNFDSKLLKVIIQGDFWDEGIRYILKNSQHVKNFKSIEEVFNELSQRMVFLKYFYSQGLPWCPDSSRNTHLLSKMACFNGLDDVKWAYENRCKGGDSIPYVEEEWEENGIRERDEWKANCHFFEEVGILPHVNNLREYNNDSTLLRADLFAIDNTKLKSLIDSGFCFSSEHQKEAHVKKALEKCFKHSCGGHGENINNHKRLFLFQQMRVV